MPSDPQCMGLFKHATAHARSLAGFPAPYRGLHKYQDATAPNTVYNPAIDRRTFLPTSAGTVATPVMGSFSAGVWAVDASSLPSLPWADNALEPLITVNTISFPFVASITRPMSTTSSS